jgi:hypothetical protein
MSTVEKIRSPDLVLSGNLALYLPENKTRLSSYEE